MQVDREGAPTAAELDQTSRVESVAVAFADMALAAPQNAQLPEASIEVGFVSKCAESVLSHHGGGTAPEDAEEELMAESAEHAEDAEDESMAEEDFDPDLTPLGDQDLLPGGPVQLLAPHAYDDV